MSKQRAEFMSKPLQELLKGVARTHANMIRLTSKVNKDGKVLSPGVARPGKTAKDRANRNQTI